MVGTSGSAAERCAPNEESARALPPLIWPMQAAIEETSAWELLPISAGSAGRPTMTPNTAPTSAATGSAANTGNGGMTLPATSTLEAEGEGRVPAVGPSFRDATRVAGANSAIWTDIYLSNRDALIDAVDEFTARLAELRELFATLTERERQIIELRVPDIKPALAAQAARVVHAMRALDLRKPPSISETVDWARSLVLLGVTDLESSVITRTLPVLIKNQPDREQTVTELGLTSAEP